FREVSPSSIAKFILNRYIDAEECRHIKRFSDLILNFSRYEQNFDRFLFTVPNKLYKGITLMWKRSARQFSTRVVALKFLFLNYKRASVLGWRDEVFCDKSLFFIGTYSRQPQKRRREQRKAIIVFLNKELGRKPDKCSRFVGVKAVWNEIRDRSSDNHRTLEIPPSQVTF
ncbi:unnamed protein product, partial [Acanthoscelides obtectus]